VQISRRVSARALRRAHRRTGASVENYAALAQFTKEVPGSLSIAFLGKTPRAAPPGLEAALSAIVEAGRARWPRVQLSPEEFCAYAGERVRADDILGALAALRCAELFLACACVKGDPAALRYFEDEYLAPLGPALARVGFPEDVIDDVRQSVRMLLVAVSGGQPAIARYRGTGPLRSWVRAAAVRIGRRALRAARAGQREAAFDPSRPASHDPELAALRARCQQHFRPAFEEAVAALSPRQRNVLRQQFVHRLSVAQIARLYGVHRATAVRWLSEARERLIATTRRALERRLALKPGDIARLADVLVSTADVSLREVFASSEESFAARAARR
jgi:RNA polymerase sigma-70 factor (ECF subfamily)